MIGTSHYFAAGAEDKGEHSTSPRASRAAEPGQLRCVIVEDELMAAWMIEGLLEELGHDVLEIFSDAESALASPELKETEMLILDINLGTGMSGIDAAAAIRRDAQVPIVFCSAYSDEATRSRAMAAAPGAAFAAKPVSRNELRTAIAAATDVRH